MNKMKKQAPQSLLDRDVETLTTQEKYTREELEKKLMINEDREIELSLDKKIPVNIKNLILRNNMILLRSVVDIPIISLMQSTNNPLVGKLQVVALDKKIDDLTVGDYIEVRDVAALKYVNILDNKNSANNLKQQLQKEDSVLSMKFNASKHKISDATVMNPAKLHKLDEKEKELKLVGVEVIPLIEYFYTDSFNVIAITEQYNGQIEL